MGNEANIVGKRLIPAALWSVGRSAWYGIRQLRFYKYWFAGLMFDLFQGEYRTEDMAFSIPRELMSRLHRARFYYDAHERDERELVKNHIRADSCVIELGACLGVVSCVINRRLTDPKHHVAVEANPLLIDILTRNRNRNGCGFEIVHGLVTRDSQAEFYLNRCIVISSTRPGSGERIRTPSYTVEELETLVGAQFNAAFLDIQGSEYEFLHENEDLLRRCRTVILELHPHIIGERRADECRTLMEHCGLRLAESRNLVEAWSAERSC